MFIEVFTPFLNLIYAIMTSSLISIAQANKDTVARYNQSKVSHRARIWRHNKYARDGLRIIQINGLRISSSKINFHYVIWRIPHTLKSCDFENYVFVPTRSPPSRDNSDHVISDGTGRRRSRGRTGDICGRILDLEGLRKERTKVVKGEGYKCGLEDTNRF